MRIFISADLRTLFLPPSRLKKLPAGARLSGRSLPGAASVSGCRNGACHTPTSLYALASCGQWWRDPLPEPQRPCGQSRTGQMACWIAANSTRSTVTFSGRISRMPTAAGSPVLRPEFLGKIFPPNLISRSGITRFSSTFPAPGRYQARDSFSKASMVSEKIVFWV